MRKLTSPLVLKQILGENSFKFSKSLGQNFLIDENVLCEIVGGSEIDENSCVLEIGPGFGTLTQSLCENAQKVVAVEIDKSAIPVLKENTSDFNNLVVINDDIMKIDISELIEREFGGEKVKVCANLPYYITSPIITSLLNPALPITDITVMIQKEVAERIAAKPGSKSYGALSVTASYYSVPELLTEVPPTSFMPPPKVSSAVIRLRLREKPPVDVKSEELFFKTVRASFALRRKTLLNSISSSGEFSFSKDAVKAVLEKAGIDPQRRGETLTLEEFAEISDAIYLMGDDLK